MACPIESLARRVRGIWIAKRSGVMWRSVLSGRKRNGRAILGCRGIASGITCEHSASAVKKTIAYKERSLRKRKAYLRLRERYARRGKTFVYVDESGFTPSATRRYAYAPKGQRVYGWVAGKRRPRTSLIAARIGESFEEPFFVSGNMQCERLQCVAGAAALSAPERKPCRCHGQRPLSQRPQYPGTD
jgi:hypothetical protein